RVRWSTLRFQSAPTQLRCAPVATGEELLRRPVQNRTPVPIPETADRLDRRGVRVGPAELAAQPQHGELDPLRPDAGRVVPRLSEELIGREHGARVPDEHVEEAELG